MGSSGIKLLLNVSSEEMVLQMSRGGEESPLHWSEADWEHCPGQSACWLWGYRVSFIVSSSVLSKVLRTFKPAVQHRAVSARESRHSHPCLAVEAV